MNKPDGNRRSSRQSKKYVVFRVKLAVVVEFVTPSCETAQRLSMNRGCGCIHRVPGHVFLLTHRIDTLGQRR